MLKSDPLHHQLLQGFVILLTGTTDYLQEQLTLLTDLLLVLISRIDHSRVMLMFHQVDHIPPTGMQTTTRQMRFLPPFYTRRLSVYLDGARVARE